MSELDRILSVPVDDRDGEDLVDEWQERLGRPGGTRRLFPHQALALQYAVESDTRGLFLPLTTGAGKTLLGMLLPDVMGYAPEDVVVLCPPGLEEEALAELPEYQKHFKVRAPRYVAYTRLSDTDAGSDLLDDLKPKLIIADEAHSLKRPKAARTRRFLRFMRANPDVRFVAMSATFTNSGLGEFAHLLYLALGQESPLPIVWPVLESWSRVVDVNNKTPASTNDYRLIAPLVDDWGPDEDENQPFYQRARQAVGARLRSAPGVVVSDGDGSVAEIVMSPWMPHLPERVKEAIAEVKATAILPNGTIVTDPYQKVLQLSMGFYYYPDWAAIGRSSPDLDWLYARRDYEAQLRYFQGQGRRGLDSQALVERALEEGEDKRLSLDLRLAWEAWKEQMHKPEPPQAAEWMTTEVLEQALEYAHTHDNMLVWASYDEVHDMLGQLGLPVAARGRRPPDEAHVGVSVDSHSTGYNLQHRWFNNLVLTPPANAGVWQQLTGRTDRTGQLAPVVTVAYGAHIPELRASLASAKRKAEYIRTTTDLSQRLLTARYT